MPVDDASTRDESGDALERARQAAVTYWLAIEPRRLRDEGNLTATLERLPDLHERVMRELRSVRLAFAPGDEPVLPAPPSPAEGRALELV